MRNRLPGVRPTRWAAAALAAGLIAGASAIALTAQSAEGVPASADLAPRSADAAGASEPTVVTVGFYADNLQGLDQQDNSYFADFFLWMRWRGDRDPTATFEFTNNVERWGLTTARVYDKPLVLPNGEKVQQYRVQGKFFQPLNLSDYPLDSHDLTLIVEDTTYAEDELVYVADTAESGRDDGMSIPGWNITGTSLSIDQHFYDTDFGEPASSTDSRTYSAARFVIHIERPKTFFFWKLFLPLVIVLLLAGSVLFIHPSLIEVRLAAPATALLSLVFLQQGYSSTLPEIGSLVLLDKIYAIAYSLIIVLMLSTIVTSYWARVDSEDSALRISRLDKWAAVGAAIFFLVGSTTLVAVTMLG